MNEVIPAYPLRWPVGWKRTPGTKRIQARFGRARTHVGTQWTPGRALTVAEATERLVAAMLRFAVARDDLVVSTNLLLRLDGLPRSGQPEPADPGAALYWAELGRTRCMAIDRYDRVADNIAALAATVEAMRAIERHGSAEVLERAFMGFAALPAPGGSASTRSWREVLGFGPDWHGNAEAVEAQYRRLASQRHPDKGGSAEAMAELNLARQQALEAI